MNGDIVMAEDFVKPLLSLQVDPPAKGAKRLKIDGPGPSCPEYLGQLIHDKKVITALPMYGFSTYHVIRLLNQEIENAAKILPQDPSLLGDLVTSELDRLLPESDPNENEGEISEKVFAPKVESRKDINMVGRLLGPQGVILQALEANTGTKVTIRGKQSLRKGQKPRPGDDEELHVIITCKDTPTRAKLKMEAAQRDLMNLWTIPKIGEVDEVKTRQLRLAKMMEGNYSEEEDMEESDDAVEITKAVDYEKELSLPPVTGEEKVTLTAKVPIPVDEKPEFNWVGRIIGPGGVTLKSLENKSGCKVSLRGKGSVRDSEVASGIWKPSMDSLKEPLHILITALDESQRASIRLQKCIEESKKLLVLPTNPEDDEVKKEQQKFIEDKKKRGGGGGGGAKSLMSSQMQPPAPLMSGNGGNFHPYGRLPPPLPMAARGGYGAGSPGGFGGAASMYGGGIGDATGFSDGYYDNYSWDNGNGYGTGRGGGKMQSAVRGRGVPRGGFGQGAAQGIGPGFGMGGGMSGNSDGMRLRVQPYPLIGGNGGNRGVGRGGAGGGRQSSYLGGAGYH